MAILKFPEQIVEMILAVILLAGCGAPAISPTPDSPVSADTWVRTFEGSDYGAFLGITLTQDGNILAVGSTNHLHVPPYSGDALFMKLNPSGDVIWEHTWGGGGYEQADAVVPAGGDGYLIFGETDSYGAGDRDFFLLKITRDGNEEWFKTYGENGREWPYGMLDLSNGELLIYGFTESTAGGRNVYALRLTREGGVIWTYTMENPGEELFIDALETSNGNLVFAESVDEDGGLVELSGDGRLQWAQRYELSGWQYPSQVAQTSDGDFLLTGFMMNSSPRQADTWLARCTSTGELKWEKSFGDPTFDDYATSMIPLSDGTYLIGAIANGVLLSRLDENGNILWRKSLLGQQTVYGGMALTDLEDGGFLVAGMIQITNGRSYDAFLMRTDSEGWVSE